MVLTKGVLVEPGDKFDDPLRNIVIFQFNPENLARTVEINRPTERDSQEVNQAGTPPTEKISFTARFTDLLGEKDPLIGPYSVPSQLASLEKMARPLEEITASGKNPDPVGDAVEERNEKEEKPSEPIPRLKYPRILFIWGEKRVLPVAIESLRITEQYYDQDLTATAAQVDLSLAVLSLDSVKDDNLARGALEYSIQEKDKLSDEQLTSSSTKLGDYTVRF